VTESAAESPGAFPDPTSGDPRLQRAWRRAFELDHPVEQLAPRLDVLDARLRMARGQVDEARALLERAMTTLAGVLDHDGLCLAKLALVELHSRTADFVQAEERAREALDIAARHGLRLREADAWVRLAQILRQVSRAGEFAHALDTAQHIVVETGYRRLAPVIASLRAGPSEEDSAQAPDDLDRDPPTAQALS